MIEWSLDAFRGCGSVTAIVAAAPPGLRGASGPAAQASGTATTAWWDVLGEGDGAEGPSVTVVDGGATRAQSVANALEAVETGLVAIHDAARPLVTRGLIEAIVATLEANPSAAGAIAATPVTDTVKQVPHTPRSALTINNAVNALLTVESSLDRARLWAAQTPQVFRTGALREALEIDEATRDAATDEAMLVEAAGGMVLLHPVTAPNLKVTTRQDLRVAELLLAERA